MVAGWTMHAPLDPECPENPIEKFYDDPMSDYVPSDVMRDIAENMEAKHRGKCTRCQEYGMANIEVQEPW